MKVIDEKGRLFGRLNLIDLLVILLIVLAAAAAASKMHKTKSMDTADATIRYTLCIKKVRQQSVEAIEKNKEGLVDAEKGETLGNIVAIEQRPAEELVQLEDGSFVLSEYPDKYDLYITMETPGRMNEKGIYAQSGKKILYGDTIGIDNGYAQTFGEVEQVEILQ